MRKRRWIAGWETGLVVAALLMATQAGALDAAAAVASKDTPRGRLATFSSQAELDRLLDGWKRRQEGGLVLSQPVPVAPAPVTPAPPGASTELDSVMVTGANVTVQALGESITNVQTAGVDEGGIVKQHGDHLVILRRGRLFTVRIGDDDLRPVSAVDAFAPGLEGDAWYDEMLISGDRVVVIGYSYARIGTEIGLFQIDHAGKLAYLDTWHLRSDDYYSSRNYASRLIGSTLIFYTPLYYDPWSEDGVAYPGLSHWGGKEVPQRFERLLPARRIYRADAGLDPSSDDVALHTVTRCELKAKPMTCASTGVLGAAAREFYVSRDAVFVWTEREDYDEKRPPKATVLRIPLDGGPASALNTRGAPVDQLSFLEEDGHLNVLLQSEGGGVSMWGAEWGEGRMALLRARISSFGGLRSQAPESAYRKLPEVPEGDRQNRYIGSWLVYGSAPWSGPLGAASRAYALRFKERGPAVSLAPTHGVERIEAMGGDAVLIGNQGDDLVFSSVSLGEEPIGIRDGYRMAKATQGERRTHGFFYRNDGVQEGIIGLPVMRPGASSSHGFLRAPDGKAAVTYLRNSALQWTPLGEVSASPTVQDDQCKASCVDWYGNARPIFIGKRVFALLGYELVEARIDGDGIVERRRVDFSPVH